MASYFCSPNCNRLQGTIGTSLYSVQVSIQYKSLFSTNLYSVQVSIQYKSLFSTSLYSVQNRIHSQQCVQYYFLHATCISHIVATPVI